MNALVHTSSRAQANQVRIARVAAAGRVQAARVAREQGARRRISHQETAAAAWLDSVVAAGATHIGFKICLESGGKWRPSYRISTLSRDLIIGHLTGPDEVEAWGYNDDDADVGTVWV